MNKVILMGRLARDPEVRYTQGENPLCIARFTLAVDRRFKKEGEQSADFISCVSFGKTAETISKYLKKGSKICASGRIQTGNYTNKEGAKVYTTDIVVEEFDFAESKSQSQGQGQPQAQPQAQQPQPQAQPQAQPQQDYQGFMNIPDGLEDELPFN